MKKSLSFVLLLFVALAFAVPAFADKGAMTTDDGQAQVKNVQTGSRNTATGWVEVMDHTHAEAAKGKSTGEQLTGVVAGGAIGARRAIHRTGAGIIDLITFWIPKKQPLVNPENARLE
ncbi:MAG: hypothetical protein ACREH5_01890 [Candidatus Omnitrophota bacterium]